MAWISVHEQVLGIKLRKLSKSLNCSQNEALGLLVRLWLWGINNADSTGIVVGADKEDIAEVMSVGVTENLKSNEIVAAMICTGWLDEENGALYIHDWEQWQKQWYKALESRGKIAERVKRFREREKQREIIGDASVREEKKDTSGQINSYSKDFESFWEIYPRKTGKAEAYKKYRARLNDGFSPEELLLAAQKYSAECSARRTEVTYIKHGKTFLSENTPFTDYLPKQKNVYTKDNNPFEEWR